MLLATVASGVVAHDGASTSMEILAEGVPAGSGSSLVGLDFFPGETLQIRLTGPTGVPADVGVVKAGPDGHFDAVVQVPAGILAGPYTVDAISQSGITVRALVTIDPAAPPASPGPLVTTDEAPPAPDVDVVPFVAVVLAVLGLATLGLRTRRVMGLR